MLLPLLLAQIVFAAEAPPATPRPADLPATAPSIATQPLENFRYTMVFDLLDADGNIVRTVPPIHYIFLGDRVVMVDFKDTPYGQANLKTQSVRGPRGNGGTLEEMKRKLDLQRKRVLEHLDDFKDPVRMRLLYDPQLKAEQAGQTLKLSNDLNTYEIELAPIVEPQRHRLYLVERLQAYANTTMDVPAFGTLAITDELEKRQSYGRVSTVKMILPGGTTSSVRSTATFAPLTDEEVKKYTAMEAK